MAKTIKALFPGRREVELAVEHLVQEYGIERTDIFIEPAGDRNSAGEQSAGGNRLQQSGPSEQDALPGAYDGQLVVSVDMNDDEGEDVTRAFRDAGAVEVAGG